MASLIAPLRSEPLFNDLGAPTIRFANFLEGISSGANSASLESVIAIGDVTTVGNQTIVCTNTVDITVTLNSNPFDNETVTIIRKGDGKVRVSGAINGDTFKDIMRKFDAPTVKFSTAVSEWAIV